MSTDNLDDISHMCKVFRTVNEMVHDRDYFVTQSELDMDLETFKSRFAPSGNLDRSNMTFVVQKKNDPSQQLFVFFLAEKGISTGKKLIAEIYERMVTSKVDHCICIHQNKLSHAAKSLTMNIGKAATFETFDEIELRVNITRHILVPKHEILTAEEKSTLLSRYRLKETQLPRIQLTDPVAKYLGLKRGQVVKILRESETAGRYVSYRLAV